ncbi:CMT1A duplicated region transcript 1 protein [Lagopus leucura]|uniref:CMT1A duplicated region transcript 1 protein n=1 Tax=Lagopus leucura TaxID=30410 RepID=UPI001C677F7A|nr:CMT1A duplicated region transcript 1 protein [Lagopus leucura]
MAELEPCFPPSGRALQPTRSGHSTALASAQHARSCRPSCWVRPRTDDARSTDRRVAVPRQRSAVSRQRGAGRTGMAAVRGCGFDPRLGTERGRGAAGSGGTELLLRAGRQTPAVRFCPPAASCPIPEGPGAEVALLTASSAHGDIPPRPTSLPSLSRVTYKDFIRCLPVHLSQYILGLLDNKSLKTCASVSKYWAFLAKEVEKEHVCQKAVQKKILYLQGLCPRGAVSNYAKIVNIAVPQLNEKGCVIKVRDHSPGSKTKEDKEEEIKLQAAYHDLQTDTIQLEERNVFCGSYSIRVLTDRSDPNRVIHYAGGDLVAIGSADRKVRIFNVLSMREVPPLLSGHAGSIKALLLDEKKGLLLSTSCDLSIRCWNIYSGACMKIFTGHCRTITCLDLHSKKFVSGGTDGMVKVWNLDSGVCLKTLKHSNIVYAVKMDGTHVVSGCDRGLVKVWHAGTGTLLKQLEGHLGPVRCLSFDQWHLVSGSSDGYVLGWSMVGELKRCLTAFRHPKEVLSLELLYLRVVSSCADGKIRVFNFLTGSCLRVLLGSSRGDPVSFCASENRMVISAPSSLLMFQFEDVTWDYTLGAERELVWKQKQESCPLGTALTPSQQTKSHIASQMRRLKIRALCNELIKPAACQQQEHLLESRRSSQIQAEQQELFAPDGASEYGTSVLAHPDRQQGEKKGSLSSNKLLLTVSMLQKSGKPSFVRSSTKHPAATGKALECLLQQQQKRQIYTTPLQQKKDLAAQFQRARSHSDSLTMKRSSVPFETKMLQLKLKNSLHGPTVNSSIPAPCIVRLKTCGASLQGKKVHGAHSKGTSLPEDRVQHSGTDRTASEQIKSTRVMIPQMKNEAVCRGKKPFCPHAADPSQADSGFRLLTGQQKEARAAAAVAQCQAKQAKLVEDHQRARKKAWLRKAKGLPTVSFTKEGKIFAPELGHNTFI